MEVPFNFETSEYYDRPQTSMLVGIGLNITDRLLFNKNIGINVQTSFVIPVILTAMIEDPKYEIFEASYNFPSYIFSAGFGLTFKYNNFLIDTGVNIRYFSMNNLFSEYRNFTTGFYVTPAFIFPFQARIFEIGVKFGLDLYSNSTINLLIEKETLKYNGGYNMFYFSLYFGLGFKTNK